MAARDTMMDQGLVPAPEGLPEGSLDLEELFLGSSEGMEEEDITDVEITQDEDGGATLVFGEEELERPEGEFGENLAEVLPKDELSKISSDLRGHYDDDRVSRADWEKQYTDGLALLGLTYENRTEPFQGATGVVHPMLNEAVTQFQAGAYKELLPSSGPVRTTIIGTPTPDLEISSQRVQDYMNYQIMYQMREYEPEFDQMLYYLGLSGSAFKKVYFDEQLGREVSKFVPSDDLIVNYAATDLRTAERITHVIRMSQNSVRKLQVSGFYADVNIMGNSDEFRSDIQDTYDKIEGREDIGENDELTLIECHCYLDLESYPDMDEDGEETGIKLPYLVTICMDTDQILSVRRNYVENDPRKDPVEYFVQYKFTPGLGFYGFGLIHLLGNNSRSATSTLRQLIDAGTLSNLPAGFKARGLRIADDANPIQPGEFRDVDVPGNDLRGSLLPLPYKEPSATLFQLLGFVVGSAEKFVGTTELGVGDANQEMPVGTTIALMERGAKVMSAVHKRLHASLKIELGLLAGLFAEGAGNYPYDVSPATPEIKKADFDGRVDVLPVSDPNIFSMSQRVSLAQEQFKLATGAPQMHNMYEAYRRMYEALGIANIDQLLTPPVDAQPIGPLLENSNVLSIADGVPPPQAFMQQDHRAHISTHIAFMQTPIMQTQPILVSALQKHIFEHLTMLAQQMAEQQVGQQGVQVPPEMMANAVAQQEAQLMQEFAQMLQPPQAEDPIIALKQQDLALREQELLTRTQSEEDKLEAAIQKAQNDDAIDRERIQSQQDIAKQRADVALYRTDLAADQKERGL